MPRLTEQEQQEIIRYLEADQPLPDKYRFLLFDDKREVELVWNGKTNEVCNVVRRARKRTHRCRWVCSIWTAAGASSRGGRTS